MLQLKDFANLRNAFDDGVQRGLHSGLQVYISVDAQPLLSVGMGDSRSGVPLTETTIMPWRSAGKPVTAFLVMKRVEEGRLCLQTKIGDVLSEARMTDKADITIFDLLTHQSGFPQTDTGWPHVDWDDSVARSLQTACQLPVGSAAYHPQSSWFILGEILRRLESESNEVSFDFILRRDVFDLLGMVDVWCGIPSLVHDQLASRLPVLYERVGGQLRPSNYGTSLWLTAPSPGGNLRGPVSRLGRFLEVLLRQGVLHDGRQVMSSTVVQQMTSVHRAGQFDQTLQHTIDLGLGIMRDSGRYGISTVPYGYGRYCSETSFGHGGSQCSTGFVDPERKLVVAWAANTFCGEPQHQRRNRLINEAIYQDLGFV
ncbi:MAG: serine hydrolase domain-containing protein [Planctomycetota bacterium]